MSRLLDNAPQTRTGVAKIDDDTHEISHVEATPLGRVTKTADGWKCEDGTVWPQEQDAIQHLYEVRGWACPVVSRKRKPRSLVSSVIDPPTKKIWNIGGYCLDMRVFPYKMYKYYRVSMCKNKTYILEGCCSDAEKAAGTWTIIFDNSEALNPALASPQVTKSVA